MREQIRKAVEDIGGEPLAGSGFEDEVPEPGFTDGAPADPEPQQPRVP